MSSTSPRVGFHLPADDGSEPINVATDLNDNLERVDSTVGFVPATSSTNPTILYDGAAAYETDTGRAKFRKGSVWNYLLTAGASFLSNLLMGKDYKIGIGTLTPTTSFEAVVDSVTTTPSVLRYRQTSEANPRLELDYDGVRLGPGGATATDVRIYRPSANQLSVTGNVNLESTLNVVGAVQVPNLQVTGNLDVDGTFTGDLTLAGNIAVGGIGKRMFARKTADTSRANTIAPVADPHLSLAVVANGVYDVEFVGFADGLAAADIRVNWGAPSGSVGNKMISGPALSLTSRDGNLIRVGGYPIATDIGYGVDNTAGQISFHERGLLVVGSTAGNFTINWAQIGTNATATILANYSYIVLTRVA